MKDKNGVEIRPGNVCVTYDRYGGKWTGVAKADMSDGKLWFCSNHKTAIHGYCAENLEVIKDLRDWKVKLCCNPIVYGFKSIVFNFRYWYNNKYKKIEFKDLNGETYY